MIMDIRGVFIAKLITTSSTTHTYGRLKAQSWHASSSSAGFIRRSPTTPVKPLQIGCLFASITVNIITARDCFRWRLIAVCLRHYDGTTVHADVTDASTYDGAGLCTFGKGDHASKQTNKQIAGEEGKTERWKHVQGQRVIVSAIAAPAAAAAAITADLKTEVDHR